MARRSPRFRKTKTAAWEDLLGPGAFLPKISEGKDFGVKESSKGPHLVDIVLRTPTPTENFPSAPEEPFVETPRASTDGGNEPKADVNTATNVTATSQSKKLDQLSQPSSRQASLHVSDAELDKYRKTVALVKKQPWLFGEKAFGVRLWSKQREIFESVWSNRYTAVKSCFASGKSFVAADIALTFAHLNKDSIVVITAPTDRQLRWGVLQNIARMYEMARADLGSQLLTREVRLGAGWYITAFATDDPGNIQGLHPPSGKLLLIVDESGAVRAPIHWRLNEALMTSAGARRLDIGNPLDPTGPFFEMFKNPNYHKITISAFDTPNLRLSDPSKHVPGLIDRVYVEEKRIEWGEDSPMWKSRILGEFPDSTEDTLVPLSWIVLAQERWKDFVELSPGEKLKRGIDTTPSYGLDVSRGGEAETVLILRDGNYVYPPKVWTNKTTTETARMVASLVPSGVVVHIDDIGVGGGVTDQASMMGFKGRGINVSGPATDERFLNLRAQLYWALREALNPERKFLLALPPDEKLTGQLSSIKYRLNSQGKIQIESKEEMRKRGAKSPDRADALMLSFASTVVGSSAAPILVGEEGMDGRLVSGYGYGGYGYDGYDSVFDRDDIGGWGSLAAL